MTATRRSVAPASIPKGIGTRPDDLEAQILADSDFHLAMDEVPAAMPRISSTVVMETGRSRAAAPVPTLARLGSVAHTPVPRQATTRDAQICPASRLALESGVPVIATGGFNDNVW